MDIDAIRKEYECWVEKQWPETYMDRVPFGKGYATEGKYWNAMLEINWLIWKAACNSQKLSSESLIKDAERYRWLRNGNRKTSETELVTYQHGSLLDRSIDRFIDNGDIAEQTREK